MKRRKKNQDLDDWRLIDEFLLPLEEAKEAFQELPKGFNGDIVEAAKFYGYKVDYDDLGIGCHGATLRVPDIWIICVHEGDSYKRQQFTIAHEIGHIRLCHFIRDLPSPLHYGHWKEDQASLFAALFMKMLYGEERAKEFQDECPEIEDYPMGAALTLGGSLGLMILVELLKNIPRKVWEFLGKWWWAILLALGIAGYMLWMIFKPKQAAESP